MKHSLREQNVTPESTDSGVAAAPDLDELMVRLEIASMAVGRRMSRMMQNCVGAEGTGPQHLVLRLLSRSGPQRMSDLAEELSINPGAVTAMVDRLEARDLVERVRDDEDRRIVRVSLTAEGAEQLRESEADVRVQMREMFGVLDPDQIEALIAIYGKLTASDADPA